MIGSIGAGRDVGSGGGGAVGRGSAGPSVGAARCSLVNVRRSGAWRLVARRSRRLRRSTAAWKSSCGRSSTSSTGFGMPAAASSSPVSRDCGATSARRASRMWSIEVPVGIISAGVTAAIVGIGAAGSAEAAAAGRVGAGSAAAGRANGTGGSSSVGSALGAVETRPECWCRCWESMGLGVRTWGAAGLLHVQHAPDSQPWQPPVARPAAGLLRPATRMTA